jgi:hypothetical protein
MPTKNLRPERRDIPIEQLELDPHPVRLAMLIDDAEDRQFVESVNEFGVLWPIAVEAMDEGRYRILDGQRRFLSAKRLRLSTVPCLIFRCPFREPHLLSAGVVGQALAISILEVVDGEQAAGLGEGTRVA